MMGNDFVPETQYNCDIHQNILMNFWRVIFPLSKSTNSLPRNIFAMTSIEMLKDWKNLFFLSTPLRGGVKKCGGKGSTFG